MREHGVDDMFHGYFHFRLFQGELAGCLYHVDHIPDHLPCFGETLSSSLHTWKKESRKEESSGDVRLNQHI